MNTTGQNSWSGQANSFLYLSSVTEAYEDPTYNSGDSLIEDSFIYDNQHRLVEILNYVYSPPFSSPGITSTVFPYEQETDSLPRSIITTIVSGYIHSGTTGTDTLLYDTQNRLIADSTEGTAYAIYFTYNPGEILEEEMMNGVLASGYEAERLTFDNGNVIGDYVNNTPPFNSGTDQLTAIFQYGPFPYSNPLYNPSVSYNVGLLLYNSIGGYISDNGIDFISRDLANNYYTASGSKTYTYRTITDNKGHVLQQIFDNLTNASITYRYYP